MHKAHEPTDETRRTVQLMVAAGIPRVDVAKCMGVCENTLAKYYSHEIDVAMATINTRVAGALLKSALGGNVTSMIFWLKSRARWREVNHHEVSFEAAPSRKDVVSKLMDLLVEEEEAERLESD